MDSVSEHSLTLPCLLPCTQAWVRAQQASRWHSVLLAALAPPVLQGAVAQLSRDLESMFPATQTCRPHLDNDSFGFILHLQCLGEHAHESLEQKRDTSGPRAGFPHQNQLSQISKGTARSLPLRLRM